MRRRLVPTLSGCFLPSFSQWPRRASDVSVSRYGSAAAVTARHAASISSNAGSLGGAPKRHAFTAGATVLPCARSSHSACSCQARWPTIHAIGLMAAKRRAASSAVRPSRPRRNSLRVKRSWVMRGWGTARLLVEMVERRVEQWSADELYGLAARLTRPVPRSSFGRWRTPDDPRRRRVPRAPRAVRRDRGHGPARDRAARGAPPPAGAHALPLPRLGHGGPAARGVPARGRPQRPHVGSRVPRPAPRAALRGPRPARPRRERVVTGDELRRREPRGRPRPLRRDAGARALRPRRHVPRRRQRARVGGAP